jgi:hypothetical protein
MEDEDDLEKSRVGPSSASSYDVRNLADGQFPPPSQSYPMSNTGPGTYDYETYDPYGQAGVGAGAGAVAGAAAATYPPNNAQYSDQDYDYSGSGQGHGQAPYDAAGAGTASAAAVAMGLRDGMMVMVSVGFVRSLEDELGTCFLHGEHCLDVGGDADNQPSTRDNSFGYTLLTMTDGLYVKIRTRTEESSH